MCQELRPGISSALEMLAGSLRVGVSGRVRPGSRPFHGSPAANPNNTRDPQPSENPTKRPFVGTESFFVPVGLPSTNNHKTLHVVTTPRQPPITMIPTAHVNRNARSAVRPCGRATVNGNMSLACSTRCEPFCSSRSTLFKIPARPSARRPLW